MKLIGEKQVPPIVTNVGPSMLSSFELALLLHHVVLKQVSAKASELSGWVWHPRPSQHEGFPRGLSKSVEFLSEFVSTSVSDVLADALTALGLMVSLELGFQNVQVTHGQLFGGASSETVPSKSSLERLDTMPAHISALEPL